MNPNTIKVAAPGGRDYQAFFFSQIVGRPVCESRKDFLIGRLTDLIFRLAEPYPEAVGIYIDHGWGKPSEMIPFNRFVKLEKDTIFVLPPEQGETYPPFVDQPGWLLLNEHLMGKTILDMDGRQIEVVNDVHLLESQRRMLLIHVDVSFNGFLRKWGLGWLALRKDQLVSWKFVQPLSIEDAVSGSKVSLSVARKQIKELPPEDLADALEELSGSQQQAVFSVLDSEKAAETLMEAEPRAQRQLISGLQEERAKAILSEMSVGQLADLFSVLPLDARSALIAKLPEDIAKRTLAVLSEHEATASSFMSSHFLQMPPQTTVAEALSKIRSSDIDHEEATYIYVVEPAEKILVGVADLRRLVTSKDEAMLKDFMASPVVSVDSDTKKDDIAQLFAKYHLRMLPVVDEKDHIIGIIHYNDIMKGLVTRAKI